MSETGESVDTFSDQFWLDIVVEHIAMEKDIAALASLASLPESPVELPLLVNLLSAKWQAARHFLEDYAEMRKSYQEAIAERDGLIDGFIERGTALFDGSSQQQGGWFCSICGWLTHEYDDKITPVELASKHSEDCLISIYLKKHPWARYATKPM